MNGGLQNELVIGMGWIAISKNHLIHLQQPTSSRLIEQRQ